MAKKPAKDATAKAEKPTPSTPDVTSEKAEPIPSLPTPVDFFNLDHGASDDQIKSAVERRISKVVGKADSINGYNIVVLYDDRNIARSDANKIYRSLSNVDQTRPTLLVLRSPGGDIAAAYFRVIR